MTARPAGPLLPLQPGEPVGNIYYGVCSWTDRTLIEARTFYPDGARTAADRLAHYASVFPIVEVDATYYALPSERNAHLWVDRTPPGFVFNIKAFGLFTHHPVAVERLPAAVKELLPAAVAEKNRVYLRDIPEEAEKLIWQMQAQSLAPLTAAAKLGCVLFQFPRWFTARRAHIRYLEQLPEHLREAEHQRRRAVPLPIHGGGIERLGRSHPSPRRTGGPGARAYEQLLR